MFSIGGSWESVVSIFSCWGLAIKLPWISALWALLTGLMMRCCFELACFHKITLACRRGCPIHWFLSTLSQAAVVQLFHAGLET